MPTTIRHPLAAAGLALLVAAATAGAQIPPADPSAPVGAAANWAVGHRLLREGDAAAALSYLHLAYRADPDEPSVALDFQLALAAEGFVKDAVTVLDRLVAAHPDSVRWRLRRSALHLRAGSPERALQDLEAARESGAAGVDVVAAEASLLAQLGRPDQALDAYRDGLVRFPEAAARFYLGMADVMQEAGEPARIPPLMREAIAALPADPGLRLVLIRALAAVGDDTGALAEARRADREVPGAPGAEAPPALDLDSGQEGVEEPEPPTTVPVPPDGFQVELADFYARHGRAGLAVGVLEPLARAGDLGQQPTLWLARLLLGTGREEEAAALVTEANARWPDAARGWFLRGRLAEGRGDWPAAVTFHRQAVGLEGRDPELRVGLLRAMLVAHEREFAAREPDAAARELRADLRQEAGLAAGLVPEEDTQGQLVLGYAFRTLDALEDAARHFGFAAEDPDLRRTALIQQSIVLDESGRTDRARGVLDTLHREYPDDAEVANSLGYFLAEKGQDLKLAEGLVLQALAAEPGNGAYLDSLGWVYYRLGRHEEALDHLIRAVNVQPDDPVILEHLGTVLQALGRPEQARATFVRALEAGGDPAVLEPALAAADSAASRRP
ncbi:MAG: tetratricopeptide repeat protein [Candidatus Krumholzibacteriia bacterium]